jgi:hypothetical protein
VPWNAAVVQPCFTGLTDDGSGQHNPWVRRLGDTIEAAIPAFCDAAGHPGPVDFTDTGTTSLYRNGQLVATLDQPAAGSFPVPAGSARYRLTTDVRRDQPWWTLSTAVSAAWTFRSGTAPAGGTALPLLAVRAAPPVDDHNAVPGGTVRFPVSVSRQDGPATVTALRMEISYDDGRTWQPVRLDRLHGAVNTWTATVHQPADGYASLRVSAADSAGNTTAGTITRAYRIG